MLTQAPHTGLDPGSTGREAEVGGGKVAGTADGGKQQRQAGRVVGCGVGTSSEQAGGREGSDSGWEHRAYASVLGQGQGQ